SQTATVDQGIPKNMIPLLIGGLAGLIIFIILLYILLRPKKKNHAGEQQNARSQNAATKPVTNQVIYQYTIQGDVHSEKIGILAKDDAVVNRSAVGGKTETQATTRFCPSCWKQVPADAKYCLFCGRQLRP
ncbi:MAG TPA: zinc ribbon domain-containing protein, partial [Methanocorpusculum sp.]|nr:zinc ribbon domain-containing protein [Methanocorpusculum sp.]